MEFFNWKYASRVSIILGIIGGIYLLFSILNTLIGKDYNFNATIKIGKLELPKSLEFKNYYGKIKNSIPSELKEYELAEILTDSLLKYFENSNTSVYDIRRIIKKSIPEEIKYYNLRENVDSTFMNIIYPINLSKYYVETSLENIGRKIAKNCRLEIPSNGYFELYENESLLKFGDFENNIVLGDVRVNNKFLIKIWSFKYIGSFQNSPPRDIRFNFDEGSVKPLLEGYILKEGVKYWIFKNPFLSLYFLVILFWALFNLKVYFKLKNKVELQEADN